MMQSWSQRKYRTAWIEAWYDVEKKREEIVKKLTEVKDALEQLQLTTTCNKKNRCNNNKLLRKEQFQNRRQCR
jgi:hypothetical protein